MRALRSLAVAWTFFAWLPAARAGDNPVEPKPAIFASERAWFPHNSVRGYLDFEVAPPHNEFDLGLCNPNGGTAPGASGACSGFARFLWSGYIEVQPIGRGPLRHGFLFLEPKLFGGDNVPQHSYTASGSLILWERTIGIGVELPGHFELRMAQHRTELLGKYGAKPSVLTLRGDGPYGLHATVGVRWYFGGYGRAGAH